jgi:hypothetical protein
MTTSTERGLWRERRNAVGQAQVRYLYSLLIVTVFFLALHEQFDALGRFAPDPLTVPYIGATLLATTVWASGATLIGSLALAVLGTAGAVTTADRALAQGIRGPSAEDIDPDPTALDMAFFATERSPWVWRAVGYLALPAALTLSLVANVVLLVSPIWTVYEIRWGTLLRAAGALLTLACLPSLGRLWFQQARRAAAARSGG